MHFALDITLYILLLLLSLGAVALNIASLPGNWIMLVAAALWSAYNGWHSPAWPILAAMLAVLLTAEALELAGSLVGARTFGASRLAGFISIPGALLGALLGTFFIPIPIIGTLLGAIAGAFAAAWIAELAQQRGHGPAAKAALGAALGRGAGLIIKISAGLLTWLTLAIFGFPK